MTSVLLQENWTSLSVGTIGSKQIMSSKYWRLSKQIPKVIDRDLVKISDVYFNFITDILVAFRLIYLSAVF